MRVGPQLTLWSVQQIIHELNVVTVHVWAIRERSVQFHRVFHSGSCGTRGLFRYSYRLSHPHVFVCSAVPVPTPPPTKPPTTTPPPTIPAAKEGRRAVIILLLIVSSVHLFMLMCLGDIRLHPNSFFLFLLLSFP